MFPPPNDVVLKDGPRITQHRNDLRHYPYVKIGVALAGSLFGVVHCLVWGFSFPTSVERIVWRSASLYIGLAFFSWPVSFILTSIFAPGGLGDRLFRVMWYLTLIANVIYAVARLALLDLVFRSLFPSQLAHLCPHWWTRFLIFLKTSACLIHTGIQDSIPFVRRDIAGVGRGISLGWRGIKLCGFWDFIGCGQYASKSCRTQG